MLKKLDHIGIAVHSLEEAGIAFAAMGLECVKVDVVEDQGVKVAFYEIGDVHIELLEPTSPESPIAKFLEKRGQGFHHLAYETDQLAEDLKDAEKSGLRLIDSEPRKGANGALIAFLHPKSMAGVLTELCQRDGEGQHAGC